MGIITEYGKLLLVRRMTKYESLFLTFDMWDFMAEYPIQKNGQLTGKEDWMSPKGFGFSDCYLCFYANDVNCIDCLIKWGVNDECPNCLDSDSEYQMWRVSETAEDKSKYARMIADKCWAELIKTDEFKKIARHNIGELKNDHLQNKNG